MTIRAALLSLLVTAVAAAQTTATVFVAANTLGSFGNPSVDGNQPYIVGIVASGPGTITVSYLSGLIIDGGITTGPQGSPFNFEPGNQSPLQEAVGISGGISSADALIGIFVPQSRVQASGFRAVDGTKPLARVGLLPSQLFYIGAAKTFPVTQAGTLFLGINDDNAGTNQGGYDVSVTFTPAP